MLKFVCCIILTIFTMVFYIKKSALTNSSTYGTNCRIDLRHNTSVCSINCPPGSFALPGMMFCHRWLKCNAEISLMSLISVSVVKTVYLADWKGYNVVLSVLSSEKYEDDFLHNLFMIKSFSSHNRVVQLIGYCNNSILTEYHELGSALSTEYHLKNSLKDYDNVKTRLSLCINYVSVIKFLHTSPIGVRVMCDSNTLEKTLSQYLLTVDAKLVVNDLDATPVIDDLKRGIHCGKRELIGELIAPEQVWPYPEKQFDINQMPFYDEKTDIFKIPDICNWFLGNDPDADVIKYNLFNIHRSCKSIHPYERPTADTIIKIYEKILNDLS